MYDYFFGGIIPLTSYYLPETKEFFVDIMLGNSDNVKAFLKSNKSYIFQYDNVHIIT